MSRFDPSRDPMLGEVLRRMSPKPIAAKQLEALAERVRADAAPLLEARRREANGFADYVAHWAGALVPLSVLTALAAGLCLAWMSHQQDVSVDASLERAALLGAATHGATSADLIDLATKVDVPSTTSPARR